MSGCQRCNSGCQSQNSCTFCNSCQSCNTNCNGSVCNTKQNFCSTDQFVGSFSFGQDLGTDDIFLTKNNWNKIFTFINNAYLEGSTSLVNRARSGNGVKNPGNGGDSGLPNSDPNEFMTAQMFNDVSEALGNLGNIGPSRRVVKDVDMIYGSYFQDLENYADNLLFKTTQCDNCNVACNVQCNTCLKCNANDNCGACNNGCQNHSPSSCCSSCNTCQCSGQGNQTSE